MRIQHNIMAMNAYRNYNNNTSALSKNLEKLSSGYKINRAGDDAAGLAISEKMRAQITGLEQAQDNAKSGKNLVQTAEGALQEVHDMLNRMVKLADQSANGTYDSEVDRKALQNEIVELKDEINRISQSANYNGIKLLDGSMDGAGSLVDDVTGAVGVAGKTAVTQINPEFSISLDNLAAVNNATSAQNVTYTLKYLGKTVIASVSMAVGQKITAQDIAKAFLAKMTGTAATGNGANVVKGILYDVTAENGKLNFKYKSGTLNNTNINVAGAISLTNGANTNVSFSGAVNTGIQVIQSGRVAEAGQLGKATWNFTDGDFTDGTVITIGEQKFTIDYSKEFDPNNATTTIGVKDLLDSNTGKLKTGSANEIVNRITEAAAGNETFSVGNNGTTMTLQVLSSYKNATGDFGDLTKKENIEAALGIAHMTEGTGTELRLQIGDTSDEFNRMSLSIGSVSTEALKIDHIDISNQDDAMAAVDDIKAAINTVSSIRAKLGATQNRLDHTINNLSVMTENIQDAEATIRDTDVAEEMMAYTKNNILVQSAQAMLAQANQVPQGVLQLLQ